MANADKLFSKAGGSGLIWALWSWNGQICCETMKRQLASFANDGFDGILIRPSSDISCGFMTDEFIEYFKFAINVAKKEKLQVMFADDFNRPADSTFYSLVAKERNYRSERLVLCEKIRCRSGEKFVFEPDMLSKDYIIAYPAESKKLSLENVVVIYDERHPSSPVCWTAPHGKADWHILKFRAEFEKSRDGRFIPNMFNDKLGQIYCSEVLQPILAAARSVDKTTFRGFMLEMPAIIPSVHGIPWDSEFIPARYQGRLKRSLIPLLAAFFVPVDDHSVKHRPHINGFLWEYIYGKFPKTVMDWGTSENLQTWLIGQDSDIRGIKSDSPYAVVPSIGQSACGTAFRTDSPASRAAFVVQCETSHADKIAAIGVVGRDSTMKSYSIGDMKSIIDKHIVMGADKILIDGFYLNSTYRYEDFSPPSISFSHPDYKYLKNLVLQAKRVLSLQQNQKTPELGVAVISPSSSLIADYILGDEAIVDEAVKIFLQIIYDLRTYQIPYTIITEENFVRSDNIEITSEGLIKTAYGLYSAAIFAYTRLLNNSVFVQVEKIAARKGTVLFAGKKPTGSFDDCNSESIKTRVEKMFSSRHHRCIVGNVPDIVDYVAKSFENVVGRVHIEKGSCGVLINNCPVDDDLVTVVLNTSGENVPIEITRSKNKRFLKIDIESGQIFNVDSPENKDNLFCFVINPREMVVLLETANSKVAENLPVQKLNEVVPDYRSYINREKGIFELRSLNRFPLSRWKAMVSVNRERNLIHYNYETSFDSDFIPETALLVFFDNIPDRKKPLTERFAVKLNGIEIRDIDLSDYPQCVEDRNLLAYDIAGAIAKDKPNLLSIRKTGDADLPDPVKYPPFVLVSAAVEKKQNAWRILDEDAAKQCSWDTKGYSYLVGRATSLYFFEVPKNYQQVILAFEDLSGASHISLNGKKVVFFADDEDSVVEDVQKRKTLSQSIVFPPYRLDITDFVNDKRNTLFVTSSNTLSPQNRLEAGVGGVIGDAYLEVIMKE